MPPRKSCRSCISPRTTAGRMAADRAERRAVGRRRDRRGQPHRPASEGPGRRRQGVVPRMGARGRHRRERGRERIAEGTPRAAAQYLLRASELLPRRRALPAAQEPGRPRQPIGAASIASAMRRRMLKRPRIEHVEMPYEGTSLPALLVHAEPASRRGKRPRWCSSTASMSPRRSSTSRACPISSRAAIACLIVDGPGNGESVRFRELYLRHDTERYATAAYDYLARAPGDRSASASASWRSASAAITPRAPPHSSSASPAASRGARSGTTGKIWKNRFERMERGDMPSLSVPWQHLLWIFNVDARTKR